MRRTNWFRKLVTVIVALGLVCQTSFSNTVAYAARNDVWVWDDADNSDWEDVDEEDENDALDYEDEEEEDEWDIADDSEDENDMGDDWEDSWEEEDDEEEIEDDEEEEVPTLSSTSLKLKTGSVAGLTVNGDYEYIEWSSSKKSVAKVDSSGAVKAMKAGTTVITAKVTCLVETDDDFDEDSEDEDFFNEADDADVEGEEVIYTLKCKIKVTAPNIKISAKKLTIKKGKSAKLKIKGTTAKVTWKSGNKKVATVNKGTVKALKAGKTKITAKVAGKVLKCSVTVKNK